MRPAATPQRTQKKGLFAYGALGWALGAVAVPLYIQVPFLYSNNLNVPLAWISAILLATRLIDALTDPLIGQGLDRWKIRKGYTAPILLAAPLLLVGMFFVFKPVGDTPFELAVCLAINLILVHLGYSLATIAYQAWGAELGCDDQDRSRFVACREAMGIGGVVLAVSLPAGQFATALWVCFAVALVVGVYTLMRYAPRPHRGLEVAHGPHSNAWWQPLQQAPFRWLLALFLINGIAGALPATLVPFFIRDRLLLPESSQWALGLYFLIGALSTLFWVPLSGRIGLVRSWAAGMGVTVVAFMGVTQLGAGDFGPYLAICVITGLVLGADLAMPAAILAKVIHNAGHQGQKEGAYFGLWNWVNKFNLALAPALALPILTLLGYDAHHNSPGTTNTDALVMMYAVVPCVLKTFALIGLLVLEKRIEGTAPVTLAAASGQAT